MHTIVESGGGAMKALNSILGGCSAILGAVVGAGIKSLLDETRVIC